MATASIYSGSVSSDRWRFDVFLSFRGEDTRHGFTSHLFHCLKDKGINTFIDNNLNRGEDISSQLLDTIRSSRISIIVFLINYAGSRWCLQELSAIMECRNMSSGQHVVLPVFFYVSPSDVRKQTGSFGQSFAKYKNDKDFDQWRGALAEAAGLSSWDITNLANGTEGAIVRKIASRISDKLNKTYLYVAKYPIGLEYRTRKLIQHLNCGSDGVRFIVIQGMGGIGKTTLAKEVHNNLFRHFEATSFLLNVGERSKWPDGLVHLQQQLLYDSLNEKIEVGMSDRGITIIKERPSSRKVLVILDDVTDRNQLEALARERGWFGSGSRIIVTTRDPDLVKEVEAECIYKLDKLNGDESRLLFRCYAFRNRDPGEEFIELSEAAVHYCDGLPLALEALGSSFLDRSVGVWKSELDELRQTPHAKVQRVLEISYETLENAKDKALFLDIACFFVGWDKDEASKILNACGFSSERGLDVLIRRNMVRVSKRNKLEMHDLMRDMGREVL